MNNEKAKEPMNEILASKIAWCLLVEELAEQGVIDPKALAARIEEIKWMDENDELSFFSNHLKNIKQLKG